MTDNTLIQLATEYLQKALANLHELGVPTTPENISIWYHYEVGDKPRLNQELDKLRARDSKLTRDICQQLYQRFFVEHDQRQLELLRHAIKQLIDNLVTQLHDVSLGLEAYGDQLSECQQQLKGDPDVDLLQQLVQKLLKQTEQARTVSCNACGNVEALQAEITELKASLYELEQAALIDSLTGVGNRRAFDQCLAAEVEAASSNGRHCCLLLVDIDHFKDFNDKHGHLVGDRVLRFVASTIKNNVKGRDLVTRYGGEEFAVVLPTTEYGGGRAVAESIVNAVAQTKLTIGAGKSTGADKRDLGKITVSVGMSGFRRGDSPETLFERADKCLYQAKTSGRNKVVADKG
ncbi:GGDEF domain-containing protein [Maricurvus nonylphenolicus]|uniref:GGDEF domain-containing protein n=1 Tax=Maricurvus nonylphenolicus TaxID=1008307 RepID=UPI0036F36D6B